MRFLSVCSGIEAASVAWLPLGWECVGVSEIEPFPNAVLAHHYPDVPNFGDLNTYEEWPDVRPDVVVGGTPCQSFSVAGLRGGMADARGNLALVFLRLVGQVRPSWVVWENVPGVLSSGGGRDFGSFLGGLGELGYGWAYRVLDAQFFGVAQRRRRVFVVGCAGDWRRAAAVLFESSSLRGDPAPSREAGEGTAAGSAGGIGVGGGETGYALRATPSHSGDKGDGGVNTNFAVVPALTGSGRGGERVGESRGQDRIAGAVSAKWAKGTGGPAGDECYNLVAHSLKAEGFDASEDGTGRGTPLVPCDADGHSQAVAFRSDAHRDGKAKTPSPDAEGRVRLRDPGFNVYEECAPTLDSGQPHGVGHQMAVRRLTPTECERLQGFPDGYTHVPYRGKPAADGPRYRALGNSMAVPVVRWIGERIKTVEAR